MYTLLSEAREKLCLPIKFIFIVEVRSYFVPFVIGITNKTRASPIASLMFQGIKQ